MVESGVFDLAMAVHSLLCYSSLKRNSPFYCNLRVEGKRERKKREKEVK